MTQQRVFVTYSPAPSHARRGIARRLGRASQPVAAVVAGALAVGGAIHFGIPQRLEGEARDPATARLGPQDKTDGGASPRPLPYLAMVSFKPPTTWDTRTPQAAAPEAPQAAAPPSPRPAAPLAAPRRDLAGFFADRGLSLQAPQPAPELGADLPVDPPVETATLAEHVVDAEQPSIAPGAGTALVDTEMPQAAMAVGAAAALVENPQALAVTAPAPEIETQTFPMVSVGGEPLGAVTMRGDKIHLASLVGLLELKMPKGEFERLKSAPAADSFVDLDTLQAAGIAATLDPAGQTVTLAAHAPG